ncbi:MAG: hypothetical protein KDA84_30200, partial [Planctomycetaceae bacterium]|nr:hypothetical protein [Planctomycetaceae bacterium]
SPQAAAETVRNLTPASERGSYLAGFRLAVGLLDQSLGKDRKIVLLSDNQANQWTDSLQSAPFLQNVEVELPDLPLEPVVNWSVQEPQIRRVEIGDEVFAECVYTLARQGTETKATVIVEADGKEVGRQNIQFPPQTQSLALAAQWPTERESWLQGAIRVEAETDQLAGDNRTVFSLKPVQEGRLGVLVHSNYLKIALSPEILSGRWKPHTLTVEELTHPDDPSELPNLDALCLESQFLTAAPVRELVLDQLNQGRGVVLFVDRVTPVIAGFLRELGVESKPGEVSPEKPGAGFQYVFLEHPIFAPFRSADFGDVMKITVSKYRALKMPNSLQLAFSTKGDPLIFDSTGTKGRLLLFGLTMDRADTNWPLDPTMIPFLDRCFDHVRSEP